jgi:acetyl-CoA C-acetyltransferase/acetyl-CoA acyltransferase
VLDGVRTAFGRSWSSLQDMSAPDLGRHAMVELLTRSGVAPGAVQQVVMGCAGMPADAANPARVAALRAGVPASVPALTVQRNCASGMEAIVQATTLIETGRADVVLCGGMESMSNFAAEFPVSFRRKAMSLAKARSAAARLAAVSRFRPSDFKPLWGLERGLTDPSCGLNMGQTAEVLARELGISREEQDAYALRSHERALAAREERLAEEIVVTVPAKTGRALVHDDAVREDQTPERLAKLRPAFERNYGTVTAGNACGITDGATALIVCEAKWAEEHLAATGRKGDAALARIASHATAGVDPKRMGLGPAAALPRALETAGWGLDELDLVEINEAFAAQVLACGRVLADEELMREHAGWPEAVGEIDEATLNVNGGAIALGHPVGVSGARIVLTLAKEMRRRGVSRGAATLCVGGGQGQAVLLEA